MIDIDTYFEKQFLDTFSTNDIHAIRGLVDLGYETANHLYMLKLPDNCLTTTIIGEDIWADILRAGLACAAKKYCEKGIIPFKFKTPSNKAKNIHHVEMCYENKTLYLARIEYATAIPIKALYRPTFNSIEYDIFEKKYNEQEKEINTFTATYGDNGGHFFKYGSVGILGEKDWLYRKPLGQGPYKILTKHENDELLVDLEKEFEESLMKDDINVGGNK